MIEMNNRCTSCKKQITNDKGAAVFNCPNCGKTKVIRCTKCRQIVSKYTCTACGFTGPN
ncbi:MAG: zinc finger domain-containing protein [Candidatus Woesearchaeota archaeon]|jgi:predicted RNA-binding Zn-ribbon protein involved in translation (DUF1610 family)